MGGGGVKLLTGEGTKKFSYVGFPLPLPFFSFCGSSIDWMTGLMVKCLGSKCVSCVISTVRWVPVVFVSAIICWAYYTYVVPFCFGAFPLVGSDSFLSLIYSEMIEGIGQRIVYLAIFHLCISLFLWAYVQTVFSPIGKPSEMVSLCSRTISRILPQGGGSLLLPPWPFFSPPYPVPKPKIFSTAGWDSPFPSYELGFSLAPPPPVNDLTLLDFLFSVQTSSEGAWWVGSSQQRSRVQSCAWPICQGPTVANFQQIDRRR